MDAAIRVVHLADLVEVYHRRGGVTAAIEVARRRSSTQLDPQMVEVFLAHATELLDDLPTESGWDALIAADPSPRNLHGDQLDACGCPKHAHGH